MYSINGVELLKVWHSHIQDYELAHIKAYHRFKKYDGVLTIPIIIISSLASCLAFASISKNCGFSYFGVFTGILNLLLTMLSSIKEYYLWNKRSYEHKTTFELYTKVRNKIETNLTELSHNDDDKNINEYVNKVVNSLSTEIAKISAEAPILPKDIREKIRHINLYKNDKNDELDESKDIDLTVLANECNFVFENNEEVTNNDEEANIGELYENSEAQKNLNNFSENNDEKDNLKLNNLEEQETEKDLDQEKELEQESEQDQDDKNSVVGEPSSVRKKNLKLYKKN